MLQIVMKRVSKFDHKRFSGGKLRRQRLEKKLVPGSKLMPSPTANGFYPSI